MISEVSALSTVIRNRRSVKPNQYNGVPVDDGIIREMLENARWAPTHALTEPWRFFVFKGEGLQKFADFQSAWYKNNTPADQFNPNKYAGLQQTPLKASHIIVIGMARQETQKLPVVEEIAAVACAVQNMLLTAAAHQIGCYWSTGGTTYKQEMKPFLGLGEHDQCLGMLYIGNYSEPLPDSKRSPIEDKTTWVG